MVEERFGTPFCTTMTDAKAGPASRVVSSVTSSERVELMLGSSRQSGTARVGTERTMPTRLLLLYLAGTIRGRRALPSRFERHRRGSCRQTAGPGRRERCIANDQHCEMHVPPVVDESAKNGCHSSLIRQQ